MDIRIEELYAADSQDSCQAFRRNVLSLDNGDAGPCSDAHPLLRGESREMLYYVIIASSATIGFLICAVLSMSKTAHLLSVLEDRDEIVRNYEGSVEDIRSSLHKFSQSLPRDLPVASQEAIDELKFSIAKLRM